MALEGEVIKEGTKGKAGSGNEVLNEEVAEYMTGGNAASSGESIAFDWRNGMSREDIDEDATRAMYKSMTDEDLIAAVDDMSKHLSGMAAHTGGLEKDLGKFRPRCA